MCHWQHITVNYQIAGKRKWRYMQLLQCDLRNWPSAWIACNLKTPVKCLDCCTYACYVNSALGCAALLLMTDSIFAWCLKINRKLRMRHAKTTKTALRSMLGAPTMVRWRGVDAMHLPCTNIAACNCEARETWRSAMRATPRRTVCWSAHSVSQSIRQSVCRITISAAV